MIAWRYDIENAPTDGTWLHGRNDDGRETIMQSRRIHPAVDLQKWFEGEPEQDGDWQRNKCFYPVAWAETPENNEGIMGSKAKQVSE